MLVMDLTEANFDEVFDGDKVTFIEFWAPWCAPCKHFLEVIEKAAQDHKDILFTKVNVDKEQELAKVFKIMSVPHLMVMKKGVVIYSEAGVKNLATIKELVEQAMDAQIEEK